MASPPLGVIVTAAAAVTVMFGALGVWSLWRVRRLLAVAPLLQNRLEGLSNSVSLLTDTTEACFKALSRQLELVHPQTGRIGSVGSQASLAHAKTPAGAAAAQARARNVSRQRRTVRAADRGETPAAIAAREDMAESEAALRVHFNRQAQLGAESRRHGTLHS